MRCMYVYVELEIINLFCYILSLRKTINNFPRISFASSSYGMKGSLLKKKILFLKTCHWKRYVAVALAILVQFLFTNSGIFVEICKTIDLALIYTIPNRINYHRICLSIYNYIESSEIIKIHIFSIELIVIQFSHFL